MLKHYILIIWVSFSSHAQYFGSAAFAKSAISGPGLARSPAKYKRRSGEESKNPNNLTVTVLKQVSRNLLPDKFSENRFFLSCIGIGDLYSKSLLICHKFLNPSFLQNINPAPFPCCWPAVDGCHIPIKCPPGGLESCKEYHNFKNFFSMVLMGMVDSK